MIELNEQQFTKALDIIREEYEIEQYKMTDMSVAFIQDAFKSNELTNFYISNSYQYDIEFGNNTFYAANRLRTENINPINKEIYKQGYLIIGCGLNGDPIVLNTKSGFVAYVFHDQLWEAEVGNIEAIIIDMKLPLGDFFYMSVTESDDFPCDAYDAEEYNKRDKIVSFLQSKNIEIPDDDNELVNLFLGALISGKIDYWKNRAFDFIDNVQPEKPFEREHSEIAKKDRAYRTAFAQLNTDAKTQVKKLIQESVEGIVFSILSEFDENDFRISINSNDLNGCANENSDLHDDFYNWLNLLGNN